jgi:hypothetical protein
MPRRWPVKGTPRDVTQLSRRAHGVRKAARADSAGHLKSVLCGVSVGLNDGNENFDSRTSGCFLIAGDADNNLVLAPKGFLWGICKAPSRQGDFARTGGRDEPQLSKLNVIIANPASTTMPTFDPHGPSDLICDEVVALSTDRTWCGRGDAIL